MPLNKKSKSWWFKRCCDLDSYVPNIQFHLSLLQTFGNCSNGTKNTQLHIYRKLQLEGNIPTEWNKQYYNESWHNLIFFFIHETYQHRLLICLLAKV